MSDPSQGSARARVRLVDARADRSRDARPITLRGKRVVLLLQGGGALGSYQVGAFQALAARCSEEKGQPNVDWVGGVSIGAVNAAVIAGPKQGNAERQLLALWGDLASAPVPPFDWTAPWHWFARAAPALSQRTRPVTARWPWLGWVLPPFPYARLAGKWANWVRLAYHPLGKHAFFTSRVLTAANPWLQQWWRSLAPEQLSFYGTEPLRRTLAKHVDFDAINGANGKAKGPRLSLGAARVRTGEVVFFENAPREEGEPGAGRSRCRTLGPEHVLASGALPPAFAPVRVEQPDFDGVAGDDALYWDGGVSSNTPIEWLIHDVLPREGGQDTIVFLVDLWDRKGPIPRSMDDVAWRQKSIEYGSLKDAAKRAVREERLRRRARREEGARPRLEVCQLMFEASDADPQFAFADADFSRATIDEMRRRGREDMTAALAASYEVAVDRRDESRDDHGVVLYRHGTRGKHLETDEIVRPDDRAAVTARSF
ncbi:MAG: patatin-like phospholipase family protein [Anaeromyxobacteraceae bacterium]